MKRINGDQVNKEIFYGYTTGAAIAAAIKTSNKLPGKFSIQKIGIGAGKRNTLALTLTLMLGYVIITYRGENNLDIKYYQIDEVSKLTGITKRTIRYYEDMELLKPVRTDSSYRLYTEEDIERIKEIKSLRVKVGMNLSEIQRFMGLKKNINEILDGNIKDINQINEVQNKIEELKILITEKEEVLQRIKSNCDNYLDKLSNTVNQMEE